MKQYQVKHALERVNQIAKKKQEALEEKYAKVKETYTVAKFVKKLPKVLPGKVSKEITAYTYIEDIFDIRQFIPSRHHYTLGSCDYKPGYSEAVAGLEKRTAALKDEIVLGEEHVALAMLKKFEAE